MKKKHFSLEQHIAAGKILKRIYSELADLESQIGRAYPKNGTERRQTYSAAKSINTVRSELEDRMFEERHPGADLDVYFYNEADYITLDRRALNKHRAAIMAAVEKLQDAINASSDTEEVAKISALANDVLEAVQDLPILEG